MSSYPRAKYHPIFGQRDVVDAEAEEKLGDGWFDRWDQANAQLQPEEISEETPKRRGRPPKAAE